MMLQFQPELDIKDALFQDDMGEQEIPVLREDKEYDVGLANQRQEQIFPRYIDIQKGLETLKAAIPQIFTEEIIDNLYEIALKNSVATYNPKAQQQQDEEGVTADKEIVLFSQKIQAGIRKACPKYMQQEQIQLKQQFPRSKKKLSRRQQGYFHKQMQEMGKKAMHPQLSQSKRANNIKHKQLERIWTPQHQRHLLYFYKQGHKYSRIKSQFKQLFPSQADFFNSETIRNKFHKIIRTSIRELQRHIEKVEIKKKMPELVRIDDNMVKEIMGLTAALPSRIKLIDLYSSKQPDINLIRDIIQTINSLFKDKRPHIK